MPRRVHLHRAGLSAPGRRVPTEPGRHRSPSDDLALRARHEVARVHDTVGTTGPTASSSAVMAAPSRHHEVGEHPTRLASGPVRPCPYPVRSTDRPCRSAPRRQATVAKMPAGSRASGRGQPAEDRHPLGGVHHDQAPCRPPTGRPAPAASPPPSFDHAPVRVHLVGTVEGHRPRRTPASGTTAKPAAAAYHSIS